MAVENEFQQINAEWVEACEAAMGKCPSEFFPTLTDLMFTGNRLITETRIRAEINAARSAILAGAQ